MRKFLAFFAMICLSKAVSADVLYTTDFNTPLYSNGGLIGQDGWVITGTSVVNPVTVSGGAVSLTNNGQDVRRPFTAVNASLAASVVLEADITVTAAQTAGDYFIHIGDNTDSNFYTRVYARSSGTGFQLAMGTSSGTTGLTYGTTVLNLNQTYRIFAQYDVVPGLLNDTGFLRVDGNAYVSALTTGTDATTFSSVSLRQGTAANAPGVTVDNIAVSFTAVPEPTSIALVSLVGGSGVFAAYRKRRRQLA